MGLLGGVRMGSSPFLHPSQSLPIHLWAQNHSKCTEIRARVPWTALTSHEKTAYINADFCLINAPAKSGFEGAVTRWDDIQWPHVVQSATVHNVGAFLPFHRYYLTAHEHLIRTECGYTGRMPYCNEFAAVKPIPEQERQTSPENENRMARLTSFRR
ncbi:hypothetical protein DPSP01_012150 [Paraphaeosphaeria sporulosa]